MATTDQAIGALLEKRRAIRPERSVLVAISGIDGSGKGYQTIYFPAQRIHFATGRRPDHL
jgi:hypothetical protein